MIYYTGTTVIYMYMIYYSSTGNILLQYELCMITVCVMGMPVCINCN